MKFIVSAKALWMLMEKERNILPQDEDYFELVIENKKLHFGGMAELDIDAKEDGKIDLSRRQFKRLRKVLRALEDQPLVFTTDGRSLQLNYVCF